MQWGVKSVAILDQVWLSVLNFCISIAFIRFSTKEEYGVYILLFSSLMLIQGIQSALVLSPTTTLLPTVQSDKKNIVFITAVSYQLIFLLLFSFAGALLLAGYYYLTKAEFYYSILVAFSLAIAGICAREGARSLFYTNGEVLRAFYGDLIYGIGLLSIIGLLIFIDNVTATTMLCSIGIAALCPYAFKFRVIKELFLDSSVMRELWACGRWALVGVLVTWINLNAYPIVVGFFLSASAVAELNTSRLFFMPLALLITAWSNLFRPQISKLVKIRDFDVLEKLYRKTIIIGFLGSVVFTVGLMIIYPRLELLLGESYWGLQSIALMWALFFLVSFLRSVFMALLMTSADGYKELQKISWIALVVSMLGLGVFTSNGLYWVVGVLICVEFVQLVLIILMIKKKFYWKVYA